MHAFCMKDTHWSMTSMTTRQIDKPNLTEVS